MSSQSTARQIQTEQGAYSTFVQGVFVSAGIEDPSLSTVQVLGITLSNVSKLKHVTLTAGDAVLMIKGSGMSMTIIGVIVGNPNNTR